MNFIHGLQSTGGTPKIREHIFDILDILNIRHNRGVFTAKAFVHIISSKLQTGRSAELRVLFESLQDALSGKVRSPRSTAYLHAHVLSLVKEIGGDELSLAFYKPISSALITPEDGDDSTQVVRDRRAGNRTSIERVVDATVMMSILFIAYMLRYINTHEADHVPPRFAFDLPPLLENPDEQIHLPTIRIPDREPDQGIRQTIFGFSRFMNSHGASV